jgi:hypothetical protein
VALGAAEADHRIFAQNAGGHFGRRAGSPAITEDSNAKNVAASGFEQVAQALGIGQQGGDDAASH